MNAASTINDSVPSKDKKSVSRRQQDLRKDPDVPSHDEKATERHPLLNSAEAQTNSGHNMLVSIIKYMYNT